MRKITLSLLALLLFSLVSPLNAQSERITIMASHSILADVVANVGGNAIDTETLIPFGADPHAFQPSSRDLANVASVDIIFVNGALLEEGLLDTIENVASETQIVIASSCIEVRLFSDDESEHEEHSNDDNELLESLCNAHYTELGFEADHHRLFEAECEGDNFHEHEDEHEHTEGCDPHVWTSPKNVMLWTLLIRDTLIENDPDNVDSYTANAESYIAQLQSLENDFIQTELARIPEQNRILVTNHDAFAYFADAYDFQIVSTIIPGGSTLAETSASSIVTVIETINVTGVSAIFSEITMSEDIAQQIASEKGAEVYLLYSGALGEEGSPASTYLDYMRYNVSTIAEALSDD